MRSVWLVFCVCGFHSICPLMDKRLMEGSWWERLTEGETGSCSDGRAMLSKSLIQFSVDRRGCVPSPLFELRPNYGGGNVDNGYLLRRVPFTHWCIQCPRPCSRPLLTHASARDSWTLPGKSGSVSCGVTAPFSWVLVHTRFCLCLSSLLPQSCVSPGGSMVGLMMTFSKMACAIPRSAPPRVPAPMTGHSWPVPLKERLKHSKTCLAQAMWGLLVCIRFCLSPPSISGGYGVWF